MSDDFKVVRTREEYLGMIALFKTIGNIDDIQAVLTDLENDGDIRDTSRPGWEYAKIYEAAQ
jgi:hypothetical protein